MNLFLWIGPSSGPTANAPASHGHPDASDSQELVSKNMTPDQIAEAERLVAEWEPNPAQCEAIAAEAEN